MKSEILFCAIALTLVACGDDSSSSSSASSGGTSQNLNSEYEYWLNQDNAGSSLAAPCNMNGVDNCAYGSLVDSRTVAADYLNPAVEYGTLEDSRDGESYKTVVIGENTWMAQNLNYNTGDTNSTCYDNSETFCKKFGRLYTETALQSALCPTGWHIASYMDWYNLRIAVSGTSSPWYARLLAKNAWYFLDPADETEDMDDGFGFSMLPSLNLYSLTMFAEGDEFGDPIRSHSSNVYSANEYASVRCVKDVETSL